MDKKSLKNKTIMGMIWKTGENGAAQAIHFVVSIILARMLLPEDYGIVALVSLFITICDKLVVGGFATSLVQKKDADNKDFSTVFFFSLVASIVFFAALFFCAPIIADFYDAYDRETLIPVIRVMGLQIVFVGINSVQNAYVSRTMQFHRHFVSNLIATIIAAVVSIAMVYNDFGVWALVAQYIIKAFVGMVVLWFTVKWRPDFVFSLSSFKELYSYGWKIFLSSIIRTLYNDARSLVIGKVYSSADLAFYNKGQSFPQLLETNVAGAIDSVLFPALSMKQADKSQLLSMLRRSIKTSTYIITPMLVGLAAVSTDLVTVLLTENWLECVFYLQIISVAYIFVPIANENLQAIKAIGKSDVVLKLEVVKRIVGIALLIIAIPFGVEMIAVSLLASNILITIINAIPNRKLVGYKYKDQILDILPSFLMSGVMYSAVWAISFLSLPPIVLLIIQVITGAVVYIGLSIITKNENLKYIIETTKSFLKK